MIKFTATFKSYGQDSRISIHWQIIKQQEDNGIIERVQNDDIVASPGRDHYLPHHPVVKEERETSKVRVVYDASSNSPSLNECLEKGPCLIPLILDILVRFRAYNVGLVSDIKQAYLNVEVNEEHRNFLRFLWIEDINDPNSQKIVYRFTRVIFGMTSSQFLLTAVIMKHLSKYREDSIFVNQFM